MKLVRLATDNDAKFDANFDTPISIEKNSQIALLNLTLEKEFVNLQIGASNRNINGNYPDDIIAGGNDSMLPLVLIDTQEEQDDFLHQLSGALNGTLLDTPAEKTTATVGVFGGSEWVARKNPNNGNVELMLHQTPLLPPFLNVFSNTGSATGDDTIFEKTDSVGLDNLLTFQNALNRTRSVGDRFHLVNGTPKSTDRANLYQMNEGLSFCRGSGSIAFQIEDSVDNGTGGVAPVTNNGFGIGIVIGEEIPLDANDKLLDANVDYEVYFNRSSENYSVIRSKGDARVNSTITPAKVRVAAHANQEEHDYLGISVEENTIIGFVSKDAGTTVEFFDPLPLTQAQILTIQKQGIRAYFYFNDDDTGIKICNARVSASPFCNIGAFAGNENITTFAQSVRDLPVLGLPANLYNSLPFRFNPANTVALNPGDRANPPVAHAFALTLDQTIQSYLGFNIKQRIHPTDLLEIKNGMFRIQAIDEIGFHFSDFYIVESQSIPLDSYNAVPDERLDQNVNRTQALTLALKGDRKNILATIPINEGAGQVEYETNTPQFIDIKNLGDTNIRNLRFRIVDKNFREIRTANTTNMTILIKSPNE